MPSLVISAAVREKLEVKHGVREQEIRQCLENRCGEFHIKTAYQPNANEIAIYDEKGK